ncbi:eukaryotic translation initiation factor 4E-binding protein Mextli isoform X2 [Bacillus rossius redtenbacheri]|uniref:eukaryotic translation initiation factor 4E-binding protein Mextli isoform X2 n=1 Tax=Bacillus rossius redtenbacheri TaxID=93214 RepID=UPI002FDE92CC
MAAPSISRITRTVKKMEKPRPFKNQNRLSLIDTKYSPFEDIMARVESVSMHLANGNYDEMLQLSILKLCQDLKQYGSQLESVFKDQLDRAFLSFRNGSRDQRLDLTARLNLLEIIEFRARNWNNCENANSYYKQHTSTVDFQPDYMVGDTSAYLSMQAGLLGQCVSPTALQPPVLSPGEIIKPSGKFCKPTKIPGKNYCKDEVVIRNSDSGKVMGIKGRRVHMIEELSETIISFQRVNPGAKERLVQITGPNEVRINEAKLLIEDTIRRNASPVRMESNDQEGMGGSSSSLNSSASDESNRLNQPGARRSVLRHSFSTNDASIGEYKYTVTVGSDTLKITGTNLELVKAAKLLLDDHFTGEREHIVPREEAFFISYEPESAPGKLTGSRLGSLDSGATSESEETYKAPAAEQSHLLDLSNNNATVRPQQRGHCDAVKYSREELLSWFVKPELKPHDYEHIYRQFPDLVRKSPKAFDPVAYNQKWLESGASLLVSTNAAPDTDSPDQE